MVRAYGLVVRYTKYKPGTFVESSSEFLIDSQVHDGGSLSFQIGRQSTS